MIESYKETKVVIMPSGELCLCLPVYANQTGVVFSENEISEIFNTVNIVEVSLGFYEAIGYLLYSEKLGHAYFFNKGLESEMEVLGEL